MDQAAPAASQVSNTAQAAAAPKPKRAAAKKKPIVLSDSEDEEDESLPSSASEADEASDSEDDFSPEKKPKVAPAKKYVPSSLRLRALSCQHRHLRARPVSLMGDNCTDGSFIVVPAGLTSRLARSYANCRVMHVKAASVIW